MNVWPEVWDPEREEPILRCLAMPANLDELDSNYFRDLAQQLKARFAGEVLIADGWERTGRAEYIKYLHVDELKKVAGPPPEGPF